MQKSKIAGIVLIASAFLLPFTYAAHFEANANITASTADYQMAFEKVEVQTEEGGDYLIPTTQFTNQVVDINLSQLYPGAKAKLALTIRNIGTKKVKMNGVYVEHIATDNTDSKELFQLLEGYNSEGKSIDITSYNSYLKQTYGGNIISPGETETLTLEIGLPAEITDLKQASTSFKIMYDFEQGAAESKSSSDSKPGSPSVKPSPSPEASPSSTPTQTAVIEEPISQEPIVTPTATPSNPVSQDEVESMEEETVPAGLTGILPKTGGTAAIIVYGLGIILFICGILLCNKKKK